METRMVVLDELSGFEFENGLVVIRRTSALDGRQNEYTLPKPVLRESVDILE